MTSNRRIMTRATPPYRGDYSGEPYWVYMDDGSPVPPHLTPDYLHQVRAEEWERRRNDYPTDEYGYCYCARCGGTVTSANFFDGDTGEGEGVKKDYCAHCAKLEN